MSFTTSLARMMFYSARALPEAEIQVRTVKGRPVQMSRHHLVERSIKERADYILFADTDHIFPPDSLERLLGHQQMIVGVNYSKRAEGAGSTAFGLDGKPVRTTAQKAAAGELEQVLSMGFGLCLIKSLVFGHLGEKARREGVSIYPLFDFEMRGAELVVGEDGYFFRKVHEAGLKAYVDHALSNEVGHIGERVYMNSDAFSPGQSTTLA
ncbi:MAG TPA: hypothetical protein VGW34_03855 [Allosphingosinicella sp.]|nr:hypothetical protein [Allosphingosinicella sp.]